jgi:hypothetical protein
MIVPGVMGDAVGMAVSGAAFDPGARVVAVARPVPGSRRVTGRLSG